MSTTIEWCDSPDGSKGEVWNPTLGCDPVSPGCLNCYAAGIAAREMCEEHRGLTKRVKRRNAAGRLVSLPVFNGVVTTQADRLGDPLRWRKPRRIFVNSMSDLFHERVPFDFIAKVYAVMAAASQHTFLVLTKRPERAVEWYRWQESLPADSPHAILWPERARERDRMERPPRPLPAYGSFPSWPLPNVHLGTSIEDQPSADARIPHLLACPAALLWLSIEPQIGEIDLRGWGSQAPASPGDEWKSRTWAEYEWEDWIPTSLRELVERFWGESNGRGPFHWLHDHVIQRVPRTGARVLLAADGERWLTTNKVAARGTSGRYVHMWNNIGRVVTDDGEVLPTSGGGSGSGWLSRWRCKDGQYRPKIGWVVVGGESGPGARPFDPNWARSILAQCRDAGVPVFIKQLGAKPVTPWGTSWGLRDRKGGDMAEWPADLRVRHLPEVR